MNAKEAMKTALEATVRIGMPPEGKSLVKNFGNIAASIGREKGASDYYLYAEWYMPEAHGDDDSSCTSYYLLKHRHGSSRRSAEVRGGSREELAEKLEAM